MLHVDLDYYDGLRPIAKFSPRPYYFATTKGNGAIVRQLDSAILSINQADPYFPLAYMKHFLTHNRKKYFFPTGTKNISRTRVSFGLEYLRTARRSNTLIKRPVSSKGLHRIYCRIYRKNRAAVPAYPCFFPGGAPKAYTGGYH